MSAIASSAFSQSSGSINNICNSSMSNSTFNTNNLLSTGSNYGSNYNMSNTVNGNQLNSLSKYGNSSTRDSTNTLSGLCYQSYHQSNTNSSIVNHSINGSINSSAISSTTSSTNGSASTNSSSNNHHSSKFNTCSSSKDRDKHHCRQPSDDSSVSLGSAGSTLDIDSESEVDSVLADRDSSNSQTSDEHTLHLAAAFKHHLQGLHQILDTLTNTADFFCARYQEEVDQLSEH